jgi:predicted PP-loop superfamily ATPase
MSLSLRCAVCREEFVVVESYDDDPLCLRCHQEIQRRVDARIAELEAELEAFVALAKVVPDAVALADEAMREANRGGAEFDRKAELHAVRQALAHPAVQRAVKETSW